MDHFTYRENDLYAEDVCISEIASAHGTPYYIYSRATLERHWHAFDDALGEHPHLICYAVKASSNLAILNLLARMGSGFDVVSMGELERVIAAGGDPKKVVFAGVAKTEAEIARALALNIYCFNVESRAELNRINTVASRLDIKAPIALRINPDVDPKTHPYISTGLKENKFGISHAKSVDIYREANAMSHIHIKGIACHIGSQLTTLEPFMDALERLLNLIDEIKQFDITFEHIDLGGGLGVPYNDETPPHPSDYAAAIHDRLNGDPIKILLEPGRAIAANAGILVTQVQYLKHNDDKAFAIVDAGMNDLLRPSIYNAWHTIIPVKKHTAEAKLYDVVGPVCETGDFLGKDRLLALTEGELLAVRSAGAYGATMSSTYNSRPLIPEIMVDGDKAHVIRARQSIAALFENEHIID